MYDKWDNLSWGFDFFRSINSVTTLPSFALTPFFHDLLQFFLKYLEKVLKNYVRNEPNMMKIVFKNKHFLCAEKLTFSILNDLKDLVLFKILFVNCDLTNSHHHHYHIIFNFWLSLFSFLTTLFSGGKVR